MRYSLEDWRAVLLRDPCVYCGGDPTGLDHIQPRSRRGDDGWENRAPACGTCDNRKAQRPLLMFLAERANRGSLPVRSLSTPRSTRSTQWTPPLTFRMSIPALLALLLCTVACDPPCLRGHDEVRHYPEHCYMATITIGDIALPMWTCDPPYDRTLFVCDQYELEKAPGR